MEFKVFKAAVAKRFQSMFDSTKTDGLTLYRTDVSKDELWAAYLGGFPAGTDPVFRNPDRTEHDCSACRSFINAVGNVVAIDSANKLVSIWDIDIADKEPIYQAVADGLASLVKSRAIQNVFLHSEKQAGVDKNFEQRMAGDGTQGAWVWEHFFVNIPDKYYIRKDGRDTLGTKLSEARALHDVLFRSLRELTDDAVDTVLDLIAQNSLYRGEEHKRTVEAFKKVKMQFAKSCVVWSSDPDSSKETLEDNFAWRMSVSIPASVAKIRNTAIGTLLIDLSEGVELEESVRKFESVVAPANYKRPTSLVTPKMIERAKETVEELGLTSALGRRNAVLSDISINDILFADRSAKKNLSGDVFDELVASVGDKKPKNMDKVEEVGIEKFLKDILPKADSIEVMVENSHIKNLVSLIAPTDATAGLLFKWGNNFSWAYNGDMADSIREKVKAAGGNVTGDVCCRLAWYNYDDLDLHMLEPGGSEISFKCHRQGCGSESPCGGLLDVDMNAGGRVSREPVENIFYASKGRMREGVYHLFVHQYIQRESKDVGFEAEIDFMGDVYSFAYDKVVKGNITIAKFEYKNGVFKIIESLPSSRASKEVWGIATNKYHKVNVIMQSPNHWESNGSGVGNKHYFFMLDGCVNPDPSRGFFNEFLNEKLNDHRKVFEIIGSKMKTEPSVEQLSGVGFSSTQHSSVLVKVSGSFKRVIKVVF